MIYDFSFRLYFIIVACCSNKGHPNTEAIKLNERVSTKCNCKAKFSWNTVTGEIDFGDVDHSELCPEMSDEELFKNPHYFKQSQSPSKEVELKAMMVQQLKSDWSTGNRSLQKTLNGKRLLPISIFVLPYTCL